MAEKDISPVENAQLPPEVCEAQGKFLMQALSIINQGQSTGQLREIFDNLNKRCTGLGQLPQAEELLRSFERGR